MRIILLNGPPRAGKDTAAAMLQRGDPNRIVIGFAHHLKRLSHSIYFGAKGFSMDPNHFDAVKDQPQEILDGMSWRQLYIHISENVIKPMHGKEWFGRQFMRAARESCCQTIIVPDSGFVEEAEAVVREVGAESVHLIRLHREGKTFKDDSRSYIDLAHLGIPAIDVFNNADRPALRRRMDAIW